MAAVAIAYPFIEVHIDTSGLRPIAQRQPGVIAVVGTTPAGAPGGVQPPNQPREVSTLAEAAELFAQVTGGVVARNKLYDSLELALLQDPRPSKIYGVRVAGDAYAAALQSLEAADDVTFVSLANETDPGSGAGPGGPTGLSALRQHVENSSAAGNKRIGVAMYDPAIDRSPTYTADALTTLGPLKSDFSRMVVIAARGATRNGTRADVATAAMSAMAAYPPQTSLVLKRVAGFQIPLEKQYGPSEIKALSREGIIPVIDPAMIPGESLHLAEGRAFTTNQDLAYVDIMRVLDDIDFRLKAGLIGMVGDARITKAGLTMIRVRVDEILDPLRRDAVIANYSVQIPVLDILSIPEAAWTAADKATVRTARQDRTVAIIISVTYGPAVHFLNVTLAPAFV